MSWHVYLSGEFQTDWREDIIGSVENLGLPITFFTPATELKNQSTLDDYMSGQGKGQFWFEHKATRLNQARNRVLLEHSDIVVVRFCQDYRQWNAAFDAGFAVSQGKVLIALHDESLGNELRDIDAAALVVASSPQEVVQALDYICTGEQCQP